MGQKKKSIVQQLAEMRNDKCFEGSEYHGLITHAISLICSQERQLTKLKNKSWNDTMNHALTGLIARISPEDWVNPWPRSALLEAFEFANESARLRAEQAEKEKK